MRRTWIVFLLALAGGTARADLRSPAWYDPTWHYRVPISVPAASAVNSTVVVDADFSALLAQLGIGGTLDASSPRVTRADGTTLVARQEFTDRRYAGATDAAGNARGEVRFFAADAGAQTYWLYFDITANGAKAATALATRINGTFEHSSGTTATNWTVSTTSSGGGHNAEVHDTPPEAASVTLAAACGDGGGAADNGPNTGVSWFLLGYRTNCEDSAGNQNEYIRVARTVSVPAGAAAGSFVFRFRYQAFDSFQSNTEYDYMIVDVNGTAVNHTTLGIANPLGDLRIVNSGVGRSPTYGSTLLDAGWRTATLSLAAYAGQTITVRFSMRFYSSDDQYRSWVKLDDAEWSRQNATLTAAQVQAFGANVTLPNDTSAGAASVYQVSQRITIRARVDASTSAVRADVLDPSDVAVAGGIVLYDDGSHGDATSGDRIFTNDGSVGANPTYTFGAADPEGPDWEVVVYARDASTSTVGATAGHVHRAGQPDTPETQANYWNIDNQVFTLVKVDLLVVKTVQTISDPLDGAVLPKAIPGAVLQYSMVVTNQGAGASDAGSFRLVDPIPVNGQMVVSDIAGAGSGPVRFTQGVPTSGLTYSYVALGSLADSLEFSNNGGATWNYAPTPDVNGVDAAVTHFRIAPAGAFAGKSGATAPSFTLQFRMRLP